jgi:hypothetical protein
MPPTSNGTSSWLSSTFDCALSASGQRKRPFSRCFAHTHSPLPSPPQQLHEIATPSTKDKYITGEWILAS